MRTTMPPAAPPSPRAPRPRSEAGALGVGLGLDDGRLANDVLQKRFESTLGCFVDLVEAATHYPVLKKQWVEFLGDRPDAAIDRVETSQANVA